MDTMNDVVALREDQLDELIKLQKLQKIKNLLFDAHGFVIVGLKPNLFIFDDIIGDT